jgi:hypothetical protein
MLATLPPLAHNLSFNDHAPAISRNKAIKQNLTVFLERMGYALGSEPITLDKSIEDTILADIFSRSIPIDKAKAIEIARTSAIITHVSLLPHVALHRFSSQMHFTALLYLA